MADSAPVNGYHASENVMQAALLRVEQAPQQNREKDHEGKPEEEGVEGRDQGRHFAPEPGPPFEAHEPLADRRRIRPADGERVIAEADDGEDGAEQEPGEAKGHDTEDRHCEHGEEPQQRDDDGVDEEGYETLADDAVEQLRLRHRIEGRRRVAEIDTGTGRNGFLL